MSERKYLKDTILLCGESNGRPFPRTFTITKRISSSGGSAVCYEAHYDSSGNGVLKEFYPRNIYGLKRNSDGQLINSPEFGDAKERFKEAEKEYIEPYEMLLKAKRENKDLETFIPSFEIYHGCDSECNIIGSTYIWTSEPELKTFDKICDEIHKHPTINPEYKMVLVLNAIYNLTNCICALHKAGLIHMDIKPSNFGFRTLENEILTETLSIFDINSVCSFYNVPEKTMVTKGFTEPEAGYRLANSQTDIYSIGATLFNAIIVSKETKKNGYIYDSKYYDRLRELVDTSRLIQVSETNSHPRLRNILTTILKRCLCRREHRYTKCEDLLNDIKTAIYYALPSEIAQKYDSEEKWVLTDIQEFLDKNKEKNSFLAIQYLLYKNPLYKYASNEEKNINVLVIGFGNYGQKFLDICLQAGQIQDKTLNVTVLSDTDLDKVQYLKERPELEKFFSIDGSLKTLDDIYGNIYFETADFSKKDPKVNYEILKNTIYKNKNIGCPHYIFIALGDDSLNVSAARSCTSVSDRFKFACTVSFAFEGNSEEYNILQKNIIPVFVNEDTKKLPDYSEIERMAFNVHLTWEKSLNINYSAVWKEFRKPYNYDSCISNVLSLKYKLFSVGIDLDKCDFLTAAKEFVAKGLNGEEKDNHIKNKLIWIEHRRWVTEKICLGWTRLDNLEECAGGVTKDERRKKHICIVRSRPDQMLSVKFNDKWDTAEESELDKLDELDRMSVELHKMYVRKAEQINKENLLNSSNLSVIRKLVEENRKTKTAYLEWVACLKDIWKGESGKFKLYEILKNTLLEFANVFPKERRKSLSEQIKAFETTFYPILASAKYRDYKQDDIALINNIPFILTYSKSICMAIPYVFGNNNNTEIFSNMAAATVVNPAKIIYLCNIQEVQHLNELKKTLPYVAEYMKKKHFRASVDFVITYPTSATFIDDSIEKEFIESTDRRIKRVKLIPTADDSEISDSILDYLEQRKKGKTIFAIEKNDTNLSGRIENSKAYHKFSSYKFNMNSQEFCSTVCCDAFLYINEKPYITVTDMIVSRQASSSKFSQPEFYEDYEKLWEKYHSNSGVWKTLCNVLKKHSEHNDVIVSFYKNYSKIIKNDTPFYYIIPFVCRSSVEKIIDCLKSNNIVEPETRIENYTTDSCKVIIKDYYNSKKLYDRLFANPYKLFAADDIDAHPNANNSQVIIEFDNLLVNSVRIDKYINEIKELLEYFNNKGYIINLNISDDIVSFTYATKQIKQLLTVAGRILEVYTYHKAKEIGKFDDVVNSFELEWEYPEIKNEFDCILTKGFRTLFVECKARTKIDSDYYYKLKSLAQEFGINAKAVLIADTQEKGHYGSSEINSTNRKRGDSIGITTVWKSEEISNIGLTLLSIISEKSESKEK